MFVRGTIVDLDALRNSPVEKPADVAMYIESNPTVRFAVLLDNNMLGPLDDFVAMATTFIRLPKSDKFVARIPKDSFQ